ncbi:MAG: NAD-dependent epimerase/dehydratase family protein [Candidatus Pacebacteria bacterium]|nr:NAD-dependent epimerase/dehydratase family protein [Candidatus Paceibacterota bacterium]
MVVRLNINIAVENNIKNTYFITGVAGFIGSHIAEELLKNNNNLIIGIDNFYSGKKENLKMLKCDRFKFYEGDIRDFELLKKIIFTHKVQYVFHEAAIASVQKSVEDPLLTNEVNVKGTLNILEASKQNNVKRIVYSSSCVVFGDEITLPKNENSIIAPISPYGYEKLMSEQYMDLYNNLYGLETINLRYFNVYGSRQDYSSEYGGVISIFEDKFQKGTSPTIFGDGKQYRDYIYVKDIARINIKAMHQKSKGMIRLICCGTGVKTSVNKLFDIFKNKHNKDLQANYVKAREGEVKDSVCNNSRLIKLVKSEKVTKLEDGILDL